jgi:AcrR family transcriptional regulator
MTSSLTGSPKLLRDDLTRREEILDAATDLFAEVGYTDAVTQDLAEKLQVGKGTIYRHYPSKRALFLAAVDRVMRRLRERVDGAACPVEDPLDRIEVGTREFLRFFAENPKYVELLTQERALFRDRTTPTYIEHRDRNTQRWNAVYEGLIAEGRVRSIPVERILAVFSDLVYGTIFTNHFAGRTRSPEDQARDILDVMFHGILGEAERPRRLAHAETTLAGSCGSSPQSPDPDDGEPHA